MKSPYTLLFLLPFIFFFIQLSESVTLQPNPVKPVNFGDYAFGTTCDYKYSLTLVDTLGVKIVEPTTFTISYATPTTVSYSVTFTKQAGTSGDLVLKTMNNNSVPFDITLDPYDCVKTPFITYDENSKPFVKQNSFSFGYVFKITTPLTKNLYKSLIGNSDISSLQFYAAPFIQNRQQFAFLFQYKTLATGYANEFDLTLKVSETQTIVIKINPPISKGPLLGTKSHDTSIANSYYSMSILNYQNNANRNTFLSKSQGIGFFSSAISEGNAENGTILIHTNRRGGFVASQAIVSESVNVLSDNTNFASVFSFSKTLPALPIGIVPISNSPGFVQSNNRPSISYYNVIYNIYTPIYDRSHYYLLSKTSYQSNQYLVFPYSYSQGNIVNGFKVSFSHPTWGLFNNSMSYKVTTNNVVTTPKTTPMVTYNSITPTLSDFVYLGQVGPKLIYRIRVVGEIAFNKITAFYSGVDTTDPLLATSANRVSGNEFDGVYEFSQDISGLKHIRVFNDLGSYTLMELPKAAVYPSDLNMIKGITYSKNDIDISTGTEPIKIRAHIDMGPATDLNFKFIMYPPTLFLSNTNDGITYDAQYNPSTQMYDVDFEIYPRRPVYFTISALGFTFFSWALEAMDPAFGLRVTYENVDEMPPMVSSMTYSPSSVINIDSSIAGYTESTLILTIKDTYNGLKNGTVWIAGDYDPVGFNFTFTPADAVTGDMYLGTYHFPIKINNRCISQNYFIQDMKLYDNSMIISSVFAPYPNPFFTESKNIKLYVGCSDTRETVAPVLTSFNIVTPAPVDVSGIVREVVVEFAVTETGSGIEPSRTPTVYATEAGFRSVSAKSELIGAGLYRATVKLPYGFGLSSGVYFSVYGLIDNHLNFNGYSTSDLQTMGYGYSINTTSSFTPSIQNAQYKIESNRLVTLFGYNFGSETANTLIEYSSTEANAPFVVAPRIDLLTNSVLTFLRPATKDSFLVRVTKNGLVSNIYTIVPTQPWLGYIEKGVDPNLKNILLILQLTEKPLLIQPNKLSLIIQFVSQLIDSAEIEHLGTLLEMLKSRPTPQLRVILQLRQICMAKLDEITMSP
ncbi:hypothetical protein CYY_006139 [Polysphondylium violaceum]|uniref:Uncharacterized protein n=1 Tax=Polysphondylium violaceum TaxID=133409 RepID=A0A8J4V3G5_9MYCE|nr:hypothetical protein CYY_006139 [Polysphondylium violaceum]